MKNDCTSQATNCHKFRGLRTTLTYYLIVFSRSKPKHCIVQHLTRLKWWPLGCVFIWNLGPSSKHTQVTGWVQSLLRSKSLVFLPVVGQQSISSPRTCPRVLALSKYGSWLQVQQENLPHTANLFLLRSPGPLKNAQIRFYPPL